MARAELGLIGMEVMGKNLARNIAGHGRNPQTEGWHVIAQNRTAEKTHSFLQEVSSQPEGTNIEGVDTIEQLVNKVGSTGIYWLMVKENAVDAVTEELLRHVGSGALIVDGGNSFFMDTIRREETLRKRGISYIGTGVSGGEEGALKGPAIMPGGDTNAYNRIEPLLRLIAAKAPQDGKPCVSYIGPNGAGHYVKMVHNAIEYGDMGLIGESVWLLKALLGWDSVRVGKEIEKWNAQGNPLQSYLIHITADGLQQLNKEGGPLVDVTADITRMKGTGLWACQSADELLVPIPTIYSSVQSRMMSELKDMRLRMAEKAGEPEGYDVIDEERIPSAVHNALYVAKISSYAQGIALLQKASEHYSFGLNIGKIAEGWRGGCIIRAQFLDDITKAYASDAPENLIAAPFFTKAIEMGLGDLLYVSELAAKAGVPVPVMDASKNWLLQVMSPVLVSAQVQAQQRDYFGAHGYFRIDEHGGLLVNDQGKLREFHTEWMLRGRPEKEVTK